MPELPEVETVCRVLDPQIQGQKIKAITIRRQEVIAHPDPEVFCRHLMGHVFDHVERRGKFLIFCLESGDRLIIHLRMTGSLLLTPDTWPPEKHTHVIFHLECGQDLRFTDCRRFGRVWLISADEEDTYSGISRLGIEPFDHALDADYLQQCFGRRKIAIKECLMDQRAVAGIGNIYSDEILFSAGICPKRPAYSLQRKQWERLSEMIPVRLQFFIDKNAISAEDYLAGRGDEYRNTPWLQVYGHSGQPCPVCGYTLVHTVIGGRSSVYCPFCQPEV